MKGEIFSSMKHNVFGKTGQEAMVKMLRTNLKGSSVKLLIKSAFTVCCSTNVESIVLPAADLTVK